MALRLHSRLVGLNVAAIGIVTLLMGYFLGSNLRTTLETEIESQLYRAAKLADLYIRNHPEPRDPIRLANEIGAELEVRVTIIAPDGRVLADSNVTDEDLPALENHSDRPEFIEARRTGRGVAIRWSNTLVVPLIYVAMTMKDGSVLRLATPLATLETLMAGLRNQLTLAVLVSVGLTLVFGYVVYALVSRPLRRLSESSYELASGNLDWEIPIVGDTDLATVGASLNMMSKSLRKKVEELRDDKRRTEAIIAGMSAGVVVFGKDARVMFANESIRKLLDLHSNPAGKMPMELVRQPTIEVAVREALSGADTPAVELTTGGGRVLLAKASPVRELSGAAELVVVVFHDLTEIRRTEKMRKDFIANVSHEFKTPLTSIRGYAETLLNSAPADPKMSREFLEAIERNSALLQRLVDDLLVLARLESEPPVEKQKFNVRDLIDQQLSSKQPLIEEKDIHVKVDCPSTEIQADPARLAQALSNLIENAIRYNRRSGQVTITGSAAKTGFKIEVADTGIGVAQGDIARIFERFYRVEKSRTRDSGGTGLGLAIVKHAIESQGGSISVASRLGVGTTFTMMMPNSHDA